MDATVAGALWEVLGHVEVVLRNARHDTLTARHQRRGRAGHWYADPVGELPQHARDDVGRAKQRLLRAGAPPLPGKIVAELGFGFWRFLLARRYTASLWPALRPAFPYLPGPDRRLLEAPVARLHVGRNRVTQPFGVDSALGRVGIPARISRKSPVARQCWVRHRPLHRRARDRGQETSVA